MLGAGCRLNPVAGVGVLVEEECVDEEGRCAESTNSKDDPKSPLLVRPVVSNPGKEVVVYSSLFLTHFRIVS